MSTSELELDTATVIKRDYLDIVTVEEAAKFLDDPTLSTKPPEAGELCTRPIFGISALSLDSFLQYGV